MKTDYADHSYTITPANHVTTEQRSTIEWDGDIAVQVFESIKVIDTTGFKMVGITANPWFCTGEGLTDTMELVPKGYEREALNPDYDETNPGIDYKFEKECRDARFERTLAYILRTDSTAKLRKQRARMWRAYLISAERCAAEKNWSTAFFTKTQVQTLETTFNQKGVYKKGDSRNR